MKLKRENIWVNILNPGLVDTDIRKKAQLGPLLKGMMGLVEVLTRFMLTDSRAYAQQVIAIALNKHEVANKAVLINHKGKAISLNKDRQDEALRKYVWDKTAQLVGLDD